jgi:2-dehydropantoate 2-reductase
VKGYDLAGTLSRLKGRVADSTVILPLLNGVDIFERVRATLDRGYLHPACVYIGTHIERPGVVKQRGPLSTIMLGRDPGRPDENRSIPGLFDAAGISYVWKDDPFAEIWTKFVFIAPFGLVTAGSGCTIGEVFLRPDLLAAAKAIMAEVVALARAKGVALPGTIVEDTLAKAAKFPSGTRTSFQRDVEQAGRPDERDLFGGSILRMGREFGIPVPATAAACDAVERRKPVRE